MSKEFDQFNSGLRERVENMEFKSKQEIVNFVKSEKYKTWIFQENKIERLMEERSSLKVLNVKKEVVAELCDNCGSNIC